MVPFPLTTADEDVDLLVEAVAGDGEDVQILTCGKTVTVKRPSPGTRPLPPFLSPRDKTYLA